MDRERIWLKQPQPTREEVRRLRGKMLWFNEEKHRGVITADDGEQIPVQRSGFPDGAPEGTVGGLVVEFHIAEDAEGRRAEGVRLVPDVSPRRARRRRG